MLSLKPIASRHFEGAIDISDLPAELHQGLTRYANQFACENDEDGKRLVALDFGGAAGDPCPDTALHAMLEGTHCGSAGESSTLAPEWNLPFDKKSYAAHLLATRYLQTVLGAKVVSRDRVALRA